MYVEILSMIVVSIVFDAVGAAPGDDRHTIDKKSTGSEWGKKMLVPLILTPIENDDNSVPEHKFRKCTSTGCDHGNNEHVFRFCGSVPCPKDTGSHPDGGPTHGKDERGQGAKTEATRSTKVWGPWGGWTACSATCGLGKMTRWRHCVAGTCSFGEKEAQIKTCIYREC